MMLFISCASDRGAILPHEPVFMISLSTFLRVVVGLELAVALVCLFGRSTFVQFSLVLWFAMSFMAYRIGMAFLGVVGGFNGYSGNITDAFGIPHGVANALLEGIPLYLLAVVWLRTACLWWFQRQQRLHPVLKGPCPACGGHITFAIQNLGQKVSCPHCQKETALSKPDNLENDLCFVRRAY